MDLNILWLVPVAYFIHILEESPRFVPWAKKYLGAPETFGQFVMGNIIFMVYVLISVSLAIFYPSQWTLVLGLSTAAWIFSNFLILSSILARSTSFRLEASISSLIVLTAVPFIIE